MHRILLCLFLIGIATMPLSVAAQVPKTERSVIGNWELKSVTIDGKSVPKGSKELSGLLKLCGGVEIGMVYKIRRSNVISMNGKDTHYDYLSENKELDIEFPNEKGEDSGMLMDVKFLEKNYMKLIFKHENKGKEKKVEMTFAPEE